MIIDVAYIVSHGFAARMVMQTNLLGRLAKEGLNVALIAPDKTDQNLVNYAVREGISLFEFNPTSNFWSHQYADSRKYFLEDLEKNPALMEKYIWATKYNHALSFIGSCRLKVLYGISKIAKILPSIRIWYKNRERKHLDSKEAKELIETINPKLLISTYPVSFSEAMLLRAGNGKEDITTMIHLLSWDNITCKGHFPELADEYIAWGSIMKEEFIEYYNILENKIHICGVPHFDLHYKSLSQPDVQPYLINMGLSPDKPYLFYAMSSPRFAPHEIDIVEKLSNAISENQFGPEMQLVVRPHPQNIQGNMADSSWVPRLHALKHERVGVDFPDILMDSKMPLSMEEHDMIKFSQLLSHAVLCLNSGSTVSIDSLICGIPAIITAFDGEIKLPYWRSARRLIDFAHMRKMVDTHGVSVVEDYETLFVEIKKYLINKDYKKQERVHLLNLQCGTTNKDATDKVISVLIKLCEKDMAQKYVFN